MAKWKYRTSIVDLNAVVPPDEIECAETGSCFLHEMPGSGMEKLQGLLDEEGESEWELVQCHPHGGKLLCIWKKEFKQTFVS